MLNKTKLWIHIPSSPFIMASNFRKACFTPILEMKFFIFSTSSFDKNFIKNGFYTRPIIFVKEFDLRTTTLWRLQSRS